MPIDYNGMFANAFFDGQSRAHQYWVFRPGSDRDTEDGNIYAAYFSAQVERTEFGPSTDPHPYLTDGTPETSFEITNIQENGTELTFHVHFLSGPHVGIEDLEVLGYRVWVMDGRIIVDGAAGETVQIFDMMGRLVTADAAGRVSPGVYIVKVGARPAKKVIVMK